MGSQGWKLPSEQWLPRFPVPNLRPSEVLLAALTTMRATKRKGSVWGGIRMPSTLTHWCRGIPTLRAKL